MKLQDRRDGRTIGQGAIVVVVDDDESVRESLPDLLRAFGYRAEAFDSADAFLSSGLHGAIDCMILDVAMPGKSGPQLWKELKRRGPTPPVVFITALADAPMLADLISEGAVACFSKPFSPQELRSALDLALSSS